MFAWHYATILDQYKSYQIKCIGYCQWFRRIEYKGRIGLFKEKLFLKQREYIGRLRHYGKVRLCVHLPAGFDWSDLGIWSSVYEVSPKDENQMSSSATAMYLKTISITSLFCPIRKEPSYGVWKNIYIVVDSGMLYWYIPSWKSTISNRVRPNWINEVFLLNRCVLFIPSWFESPGIPRLVRQSKI